jgi:hypothetical protein
VKAKDNEQLDKDFVKYCDQIGIVQRPRLIKTRKELHAIQVNAGERKGCAGWGECFWHLNTIFIDTGIRIHYPCRSYKGFRRPDRERIKHKSKYIDFRNTLVHELVHYRFPKMRHGWRFEQRVVEILRGRTFEPMQIPLSPIVIKTQTPKKEYTGTLDYFLYSLVQIIWRTLPFFLY